MVWKPFEAKVIKLKAGFKMPDVPASVQAIEDDEEAAADTIEPAPVAEKPKKKVKKKRKQTRPNAATEKPPKKTKTKPAMDVSRALARERAKMKALNASGGAKKNKAAAKLTKHSEGGASPALSTSSSVPSAPTKKKKPKRKSKKRMDSSSSDYDLMALMATMTNEIETQ